VSLPSAAPFGLKDRFSAVRAGRDEIGSDLVPDYLTSVRDGGFYGWPYSYFSQHVDVRVQPPRSDHRLPMARSSACTGRGFDGR
jgi:glucose/arabinose dehydrogenase